MKMQLIATLAGSASDTTSTIDVTALNTPFTRGRECVAYMHANAAYDAACALANLTVGTTGTYADAQASTDFTTETTRLVPISALGDSLKLTQTSATAGTLKVYLLGDT